MIRKSKVKKLMLLNQAQKTVSYFLLTVNPVRFILSYFVFHSFN